MEMITSDVIDFMEMASFADEGLLPVAGGLLDQTAVFVDALRQYRDENNAWEAKLKSK